MTFSSFLYFSKRADGILLFQFWALAQIRIARPSRFLLIFKPHPSDIFFRNPAEELIEILRLKGFPISIKFGNTRALW